MQIKQEHTEVDIFVATKIGSFKHIKYHTDPAKNNKKCIENLVDIKSLQKDEGVTCMEWGDAAQTEILLGKKNQQIQVHGTDGALLHTYTADHGSGHVVGLGRCQRRLLSALSGGVVKLWKKRDEVLVETGGKLDRMRVCAEDELFATGGEENDLKIYRIGEPEPVFSAKNMAHDWLQLRRGVWVSDLAFSPGEGGKMAAVCSRHGYVRLYDARAQRRPVCDVELDKMAATCLAPGLDSRQVIVGFGRGQLHVVDFRAARLDKGFKGASGAVTAAALSRGLLYSASLDRHLRVHCYNTKELLYKQYLTSKLSGLLLQTEGSTPLHAEPEVKDEPRDQDELDQLFEHMEPVGEKAKKKKRPPVITSAKKVKPSLEGSTIELDDEEEEITEEITEAITEENPENDQEDAIKKLLRSTEKQKRKMEKKKKEKKAKSVFHNA